MLQGWLDGYASVGPKDRIFPDELKIGSDWIAENVHRIKDCNVLVLQKKC